METKLHSFYPFTAVMSLLYFAASHSVVIGDTSTNNGPPRELPIPSSSCWNSSCPCKCDYTNSVLDCSNQAQSIHDVQTVIDRCTTFHGEFAIFNFSNSNIQKVLFTGVIAVDHRECSLDLSHNEISQMCKIKFWNCIPVFVDVSHNYLTNLPEAMEVWFNHTTDVPRSTHIKIDFSHNQIACLKNFINITNFKNFTIDLSYNRIVVLSIPNDLFFLNGRNHSFWRSEKIAIILHNNQISSLESYPNIHDIKNLIEIHVLIDLRHNRLSSIPEATEMIEALSFNLEGNPWNCDCHQRWISHSTSKLRQSLSHEESTQPNCHQPENVKNRSLLSLASAEFVCPPPRRDTVELACPIVGVNPPVESIEWKIWTKSGLSKPFTSVEVCGNCSLVVNISTSNWEGIYQCTAYNGVNVSSSVNITLLLNSTVDPISVDLCDKESHLTWLNIILVVSLVVVFSGFIVVSYNHCRGNQKDNFNEGNSYINSPSDDIEYEVISPNLSPPVTFSTPKERLSSSSEYLEPTNQVSGEGDVECSYNEVSHRRDSAHHARKVSTAKSSDGIIQNTDIVSHQKTDSIPASRFYNIKRSIEPKSETQDDDGCEVPHNEEYTSLNVVHVYEGHITYQRLNCPHRSSTQI